MLSEAGIKGFQHFEVNLHINISNMRGWAICFFLNLFVCINAAGQHVISAIAFANPHTTTDTSGRSQNAPVHFEYNYDINHPGNAAIKRIPSNYYFNSLGFFCRKELQIEKVLKFPVKFRLGSVTYTDQMEGKGKGRR